MDSASKLCLLSATIINLGACDTLSEWNAHRDSYFTRNETVVIDFYGHERQYNPSFPRDKQDDCNDRQTTVVAPPQVERLVEPITAAAAAAVVGIAVDQAVKAIDEEKSRYTARFTGRYVGQFYKADGTPLYRCFSVERKVGDETAMFFLGALGFSPDHTAMQVTPLRLEYPKLKAKALWTDDTAAVAITLDIRSAWKDENNDFHNEQTASVALYNHNVPFGKKEVQPAKDLGWQPSDWLTPVIPSSSVESNKETGNFSLTVTVVETTETGADIVGVVADTLRQNKANIVNVVVNPSKQ